MSAPIKVSVIGIGMSATVFHIPFILSLPDHFTLHSILERKATPQSSDARKFFPGVKVVTTLEEVLQDEEVDAVFVTSINATHFDFSKAILEAGKHVIIEKPLTPTFAEAQELIAIAKSKNLVLATYQNRRWDSDMLTLKSLLDNGSFGELSEFESHFDRFRYELAVGSRAWKETKAPGVGAEYDLGSHLLDQALWLFGRPESVSGVVRNSRALGDPEVADSFTIQLNYPATSIPGRKIPLLVICSGSTLSLLSPQLRFSVKGTEGAFVKYGTDVQEAQLIASGNWKGPVVEGAISPKDGSDAWGREPEDLWGTLYTKDVPEGKKIESLPGSYGSWFKNVAEAIQSKDPSHLIVTPEQAALVIEVVEAAGLSSREGRRIAL
ncbi:NAD binding Rossmann fold oxidoreductase [Mrakia frigida]|uniref:NAD binding Rossmann fold oxidoreductase n=1 Tax=Mrakia frigida TaxID=29902 RepID=UPI003FCC11C3